MNHNTGLPPDPIGLSDLVLWVKSNRILIFLPVAIWVVLGVAYLAIATPSYKSETLLAPAHQDSDSQGLGRLASQLGASGLIGSLGSGSGDKSEVALAILESRQFIGAFIADQGLLPVLFAGRWDRDTGQWADPESVPTINDGYRSFANNVLGINRDEVTGFVTVSVSWEDPAVAHAWLSTLVAELNQEMRRRDSEEAKKSLQFLENELRETDFVEIRQGLYQLSLAELQKLTLANVREEYALTTLDPPNQPDLDDPDWPNVPLVVLGSLSFGLIFGLLLAVFTTVWRAAGSKTET